ncbi:MAG: hypothetical protein DRJ43_04670 [Thermoprotei archaeon]|nr:MAG: hypothetical protein DRJ43_04670 [Thermoprotei archaeon]
MRIIIRRRLTPEEMLERIGLAEMSGDSERLSDLIEAYMAYEEEGEYSYVVEEEIPLTLARRLLSAKIVELLEFLRDREGLCVSEIARTLNRSPSNVYNDLKLLADYNVVALERRGRRTIPRLLVEELRIAV